MGKTPKTLSFCYLSFLRSNSTSQNNSFVWAIRCKWFIWVLRTLDKMCIYVTILKKKKFLLVLLYFPLLVFYILRSVVFNCNLCKKQVLNHIYNLLICFKGEQVISLQRYSTQCFLSAIVFPM